METHQATIMMNRFCRVNGCIPEIVTACKAYHEQLPVVANTMSVHEPASMYVSFCPFQDATHVSVTVSKLVCVIAV